MSEEALWRELLETSERHLQREEDLGFAEAYALVARCLAICHRLGLDHPGMDLLGKDEFEEGELDAFFRQSWRLATLHREQRAVGVIEARRGVDARAEDFRALRARLAEARSMILDFAWLPEERKRRHLDQIEGLTSELQRARDDFDVAMAEVDDPARAATIEIGRPSGWGDMMRRVFSVLGPNKVDENKRALPPPDPRDEAH